MMRLEEIARRKSLSERQKPPVITLNEKQIAIDPAGYLLDHNDWSPEVAETFAEQDGVTLTEDHWILIGFLHRFYSTYEIAPELAILSRNLCKDQHDCRWNRSYIRQLFPHGAKMACRYAGLPAPVGRSCI
jgi:tRNA 2-thiouridine synthesizing protein E